MTVRVIVCGGRGERIFDDPMMRTIVHGLCVRHGGRNLIIVHGAAKGADEAVAHYARRLGLTTEAHPADWATHDRAAGPIRNQEMLDAGADLVVAFKSDFDHTLSAGGTEDMCRRARDAGVPVYVVQDVKP